MTNQQISFVKSAVRVVGYLLLPFSVMWGVIALCASEFLGIVEEVGQ